MSRRTAHNVLKDAFMSAGLNGHLATHSLRKSFAQRLYDRTGDIFAVQEMLGHRNVATTQKYLGVNYAAMSGPQLRKWRYLLNCTQDPFWAVHSNLRLTKHCFLELALRGYDLAKPLRPEVSEEPNVNHCGNRQDRITFPYNAPDYPPTEIEAITIFL